MTENEYADKTLAVAEEVAAECLRAGVECAVIGAMALAAHKYPRATEDFDLATNVNPFQQLPAIAEALRHRGHEVELVTPDAEDPLGGVLNITGNGFGLVQVVNYENPFSERPTPGLAAIQRATVGLLGSSTLRVVTLPDLVALKLYAGGPKSRADITELLTRNSPVDLQAIRDACAPCRLGPELESLLNALGLG